jgi:hypothetical protein
VIYPQIMAVNGQNTTARRRAGGGPVYIGIPSLVVEIYPQKTAESEYETSRAQFAEAGILEFLAWDSGLGNPLWHRLAGESYRIVEEDGDGFIKSSALPGCWFDVEALKKREWLQVLKGIEQGVKAELSENFRRI